MLRAIGFKTPADFRKWLRKNHATQTELVLRVYKTHAADKGLTYRQALDEALCFGWIDGVRRGLDDVSFVQRFTPRRARSKWSAVNLRHFKRLTSEGRVEPPGLAAFRARDKHAKPYSFETKPVKLDPVLAARLKANARAWAFFQSRPPWYQRITTFFVMSAKREETRQKRLEVLISYSAAGKTIPPLTR